jgi:hypothetical protein
VNGCKQFFAGLQKTVRSLSQKQEKEGEGQKLRSIEDSLNDI